MEVKMYNPFVVKPKPKPLPKPKLNPSPTPSLKQKVCLVAFC